jgi:hypothetical protein
MQIFYYIVIAYITPWKLQHCPITNQEYKTITLEWTFRCLDTITSDGIGSFSFQVDVFFPLLPKLTIWVTRRMSNKKQELVSIPVLLWDRCSQYFLFSMLCFVCRCSVYWAFQSFDFERTWWRLFNLRESSKCNICNADIVEDLHRFLFECKTLSGIRHYITISINHTRTFSSKNKKHIKVIVIKVVTYYHRNNCVILH